MKAEVKVPAVGESITEATIAEWNKSSGDYVERDEVLLSLETDKASVEIVAENAGVLTIKVEEGETVEIGTVVGEIDTEASAPAGSSEKKQDTADSTAKSSEQTPSASKDKAHPDLQKHLSPAVSRVVNEKGLDPNQIQGHGRGGRITKEDAQNAKQTAQPQTSKTAAPKTELPQASGAGIEETVTRQKMSTLRKTIANRLVQSQQTAAILTTFNEIDMTNLFEMRKKYKEDFREKYGASLGFMGVFTKAIAEALKEFPEVNAQIDGDEIIYHNYCHVGIAVGTPKGLVVPVIRHADKLTLPQVEQSVRHYALKAREGKISIDDMSGGTFTISNGGVFGSLMSTPIINPPQTGILGMHKVEDRPVAINGEVVIRPMMYVALSYDHRIIDGEQSVKFLVRVKEYVEDPSRLLLGV